MFCEVKHFIFDVPYYFTVSRYEFFDFIRRCLDYNLDVKILSGYDHFNELSYPPFEKRYHVLINGIEFGYVAIPHC